MITEVCRAEHCGNGTALGSLGENGMGQHSTVKLWRSTTWQITFQLSMTWYCTAQHERPLRSKGIALACLTLD